MRDACPPPCDARPPPCDPVLAAARPKAVSSQIQVMQRTTATIAEPGNHGSTITMGLGILPVSLRVPTPSGWNPVTSMDIMKWGGVRSELDSRHAPKGLQG